MLSHSATSIEASRVLLYTFTLHLHQVPEENLGFCKAESSLPPFHSLTLEKLFFSTEKVNDYYWQLKISHGDISSTEISKHHKLNMFGILFSLWEAGFQTFNKMSLESSSPHRQNPMKHPKKNDLNNLTKHYFKNLTWVKIQNSVQLPVDKHISRDFFLKTNDLKHILHFVLP